MAGFTNRGKYLLLRYATGAGGAARPTNYYIALCTIATTPDPDTNTLSQLTEIAAGNGYTSGGVAITPNGTDFDTSTEDDTGDLASVKIKDIVFTASGGTLPGSGAGAKYVVMLTDEATVANRQVICYWTLSSAAIVSSGQALTLQDLELDYAET